MKYVLRTRLIENPKVVFYYKGVGTEKGIPMAMNTVVAFDIGDAMIFEENEARRICKDLNKDINSLYAHGFREFEISLLSSQTAGTRKISCKNYIKHKLKM